MLLDDRIADERRIGTLADAVLRLEPSAETRACAERIRTRSGEAEDRLAAGEGGGD